MVSIKVNDLARMTAWQNAMPDFSAEIRLNDGSVLSPQLEDYLSCYGLDDCAKRPGVRYCIGYREIAGFKILHQCFLQADFNIHKGIAADNDVVLIVHGYTDHVGIFTKVINNLLEQGKSVLLFDFPGHGLSTGERATIESFDIYLKVFNNCFDFYQEELSCSLHLIAQSMGGAITMNWLLENKANQKHLKKVVLFAPLVRPMAWNQAVWSHRFLSKVVSSIPRNFSDNSEDERFLHFVRYEDPVQHDRLPTQWVGAMIKWVRKFEDIENQAKELAPPIWIIQGDQDQTVDWEYNLEHIKTKFPQAHVCMVKGAGHHIAGESDRLQKIIFAQVNEALNS
jgi:lysophospholipase